MITKLNDLRRLIGKTITAVTTTQGHIVLLFDDGSATVVRESLPDNGIRIIGHTTAKESAQALADYKKKGVETAQLLYDAKTKIYYAILGEEEKKK